MAKSGTANFYNGVATTSLKLESNDAVVLQRTIAGGDRQKHTFSFWFKRTQPQAETDFLWSKGENVSPTNVAKIEIVNAGTLDLQVYEDNALVLRLKPNMLFRDPSAWYNLIVAIDSTQGTAADRARMYVNGVDVLNLGGYAVATYMNQNVSTSIGHSVSGSITEEIGEYQASNNEVHRFNGYLSDWHYVDGIKLAPTSFGELKNGVWIPVAYTGSHGDDGWHLKFDQVGVGTASTSTIGADASGNANHFSSTNIVASDCAMPDSPENNFCVMNSNSPAAGTRTFTEGNLRNTHSGNVYSFYSSTFGVKTGKWYAEMRFDSNSTGEVMMYGLSNAPFINGDAHTTAATIWYISNGAGYVDGSAVAAGAFSGSVAWGDHDTSSPGFVMGIALDLDSSTKTVTFTKDGGDSFSKDLPASFTDHIHFCVNKYSANSGTAQWTWNFGQDSTFVGQETATSNADGNGIGAFHTAPPFWLSSIMHSKSSRAYDWSDILPQILLIILILCFIVVTIQQMQLQLVLKPDFVWLKRRTATSSHRLYNSLTYGGPYSAGASGSIYLKANATTADTAGTANSLISLDANGFTVHGGGGDTNNDGDTYVAWNWKANGGTATATISESGNNPAAVVQANPTAGFSIITYTGTGANGTIAHGLGVVPKLMIFKNRDATDDWVIYHGANTAAPATDHLHINNTLNTADDATYFNDTEPTSSVFTIGTHVGINTDAEKYVVHVFAEIEGYSKFGGYVGNESSDGAFVFTGFRPAFLICKITDGGTTAHYAIFDNKRETTNVNDNVFFIDGSAENSAVNDRSVDFFK